MVGEPEDNTIEDVDTAQKAVDRGHLILILAFIILGLVTTGIAYAYSEDEKIWGMAIAFATAFYTASIITFLYHWVLINDISNLVAKKLMFNKEFLINVFNKKQIDNLLKLLLEINLKKEMGALVKSDIIDKIAKDQVDFVLHGLDFYINLSNSRFSDFYKVVIEQTVYETVVTKHALYYATNSSRIWDLLAEKEKEKTTGIGDVWLLPPNAPKSEVVTKENIKEFYSVHLKLNHQSLSPDDDIKKGTDLENLIGTTMLNDEYCVELKFNLLEFDKIQLGQKAEKLTKTESYAFKHKNYLYLGISSAFSNAHIIWDCLDTDIICVTAFSSIPRLSYPKSLHPSNKKYAITSHTPGLPGHYVLFVWRFHNPPQLTPQITSPSASEASEDIEAVGIQAKCAG